MTAPSPVNDTVVIGPWKSRQKDNASVRLLAQIETLERRQVGRHDALAELSELIEHRQHEIEILKGQLQ